jgi:hypothetical protein
MTREPKIPMSPSELPQQRIHEVVTLPERPAEFDCEISYDVSPTGALPKNAPTNSTYLCQVEWAWSPMHNRLDAYYLHRGRSHWSLWSKYWDDNWMKWEQIAVGCVPRRGVDQKQAAVYLLLEFWAFDSQECDVDEFHWINEDGYLSVAELAAIAREVWHHTL